jgi:CD63 antigen
MGMRCIKYLIFTINFMFVLTGGLLILVGLTINEVYDYFSHFMYDRFSAPPSMLVGIGIIILLVSIFGCIGAVKESTAWINVYGVLLLLIFVFELITAMVAFSMQGKIHGMLNTQMHSAINDYEADEYVAETVDFLQQSLECCGVHGPDDWRDILKDPTITPEGNLVPHSCCSNATDFGKGCNAVYREGCLPRLQYLIEQGTVLIATGALAVSLVQILGVICAFMLAKSIRQTKSLREARRWQIQQTFAIMSDPTYNAYEAVPKTEEKKKNLIKA